MIQSPAVRPLVVGASRLLSTSIRHSLPAVRFAPFCLAPTGSTTAAALPLTKTKVRRFSDGLNQLKTQQSPSSDQPEHSKTDQLAIQPEQTQLPTESTPKISRRATRRTRETLPKHVPSTDLRKVHGVGPKNEQLLLKVGLSNVASLKDRYKKEHKENTGDLKQYLQV